MEIIFNGNAPYPKYFRLGVQGNNLVDKLVFILDRVQGDDDLGTFIPHLKMQNKDFTFVDKVRLLNIEQSEKEIKLTYCVPIVLTEYKSLFMQLSFEKSIANDIVVWQSQYFNVTFEKTIDISHGIGKTYPDVLRDMEIKINSISQQVMEYESKLYFPNVGEKNKIYLDKKDNTSYRYDVTKNAYFLIGENLEEIQIINCNKIGSQAT